MKSEKYERRCPICGSLFETSNAHTKYCSLECKDESEVRQRREKLERRKKQRRADKGMSGIKKGGLDASLEEARRRGISFAELQKERTLAKIRRDEFEKGGSNEKKTK